MQLTEKHIIAQKDPRYAIIDDAAFKSKNLYNASLYLVRQSFIHEHRYLTYYEVNARMQSHEAYKALPAKVSQQVLRLLDKNWKSFFVACEAYKENPVKFFGRPKLPGYKDKITGRTLLVYTAQAVSKKGLKKGCIQPSLLPIEVQTKQKDIDQVRIAPKKGFYVLEVVYTKETKQAAGDPKLYAGIDIGLNNLATVTSNKRGATPLVVNGRPVKSINQYYNKRKAELQSKRGKTGSTKRMEHLTNIRNRRIEQYLHTASKRIIDWLLQEGISIVCIGKNDGWKQEANMGARNNQNFVQVPHARFISMLTYKAEPVGIKVKLTEESYTSKASFLDGDLIPVHDPNQEQRPTFSGKRIKRGLYQASDGRLINADVNGALNIIQKAAPKAFVVEGVEGGKAVLASLVVHPVQVVVPCTKPKKARGQ